MISTVQQQIAYQQSEATRLDSAACLLAAFRRLGIPETMMDIGCGPGHLVQIADSLGVKAEGIDISLPEEEIRLPGGSVLFQGDIMDFVITEPSELVLCLEVAEHLPEEAADELCNLLVQATAKTLLFSAATPGQGGSGHINEQSRTYWVQKLEKRGMVHKWPVTEALRGDWAIASPGAWWYPKNLLCFYGGA